MRSITHSLFRKRQNPKIRRHRTTLRTFTFYRDTKICWITHQKHTKFRTTQKFFQVTRRELHENDTNSRPRIPKQQSEVTSFENAENIQNFEKPKAPFDRALKNEKESIPQTRKTLNFHRKTQKFQREVQAPFLEKSQVSRFQLERAQNIFRPWIE